MSLKTCESQLELIKEKHETGLSNADSIIDYFSNNQDRIILRSGFKKLRMAKGFSIGDWVRIFLKGSDSLGVCRISAIVNFTFPNKKNVVLFVAKNLDFGSSPTHKHLSNVHVGKLSESPDLGPFTTNVIYGRCSVSHCW